MKPNIAAILEDCIERGISRCLINRDAEWTDEQLSDAIQQRIWFEIDLYFDFETNENHPAQ
jgi:hypothetical protein